MKNKGLLGGILKSLIFLGIISSRKEENKLPQFVANFKTSDLKAIYAEKMKSIQLSNGMKEFNIDGVTKMALNKKNAIRKVENDKKKALQLA